MLGSMGNDPLGDNGSDSRQGVEFGGSGPVEMYWAITCRNTPLRPDRRTVRTRNEHLHPVDYRLGEVDRLCQPPRQRPPGSGNRISDPGVGRKVHQSWARDPASDVDRHRVSCDHRKRRGPGQGWRRVRRASTPPPSGCDYRQQRHPRRHASLPIHCTSVIPDEAAAGKRCVTGYCPGVDTGRYRVNEGEAAGLASRDPSDQSLFEGDKGAGKATLAKLNKRLEGLQELFYADGRHRFLVVLQATDTGGKDGTISSVFDGVNPLGVKVASFKKPTEAELAHDFLWRVHPHVPSNGEIVIFNRSHYEDVLIVRVHNLVPEERWRRRYQQIVDFERLLIEEGTTIVKFFLHISKDEQRERLQARIDDHQKRWKFSLGDLDERQRWNQYQDAFEEAISRTSTDSSPWYVIPANRKWYRDIVVATILVQTLEALELRFPKPEQDLSGLVVE